MSTPLRSPLTGLAIYNPDLLRKEDLIVQFVARQSLLDLLVDDLRRASASGGIQHHLIIGQRGMGKPRCCGACVSPSKMIRHCPNAGSHSLPRRAIQHYAHVRISGPTV